MSPDRTFARSVGLSLLLVLGGLLGLLLQDAAADTATYTVPWLLDAEGFSWTSEQCVGTCTQAFTVLDGNPAGSVYARVTERNKKTLGYWGKSLTWETMGVPTGSTVTSVDGLFDVKLAEETHAATQAIGLKLFDSGNTVNIAVGGVDIETEFDSTSTSWVTRNTDGAKDIQASYQASGTTVTIRMREDVNSGNNASAASEVRVDNVVFVITYTPPSARNRVMIVN
jgi:hypothetical protein